MENNGQRPERKKNAFNNTKLTLSAPCPTAKGKYSTLGFEFHNNNPAIVVRTNDPADMDPSRNYGRIMANMDTPAFFAFITNLKEAIAAPGEFKRKCENHNHDYVNGRRSEEIVHISDLWVGKDKDGCVYLSVLSKKDDRAVIKFIFGPSDNRWHKYFHGDGQPFTKGDLSMLYAKAWTQILGEVTANLIVQEYVAPVPRKPFGGNGGGQRNNSYGGGNNRPNNGGYNKPASVEATISEDDLPF